MTHEKSSSNDDLGNVIASQVIPHFPSPHQPPISSHLTRYYDTRHLEFDLEMDKPILYTSGPPRSGYLIAHGWGKC
jgi:hypothetical protein